MAKIVCTKAEYSPVNRGFQWMSYRTIPPTLMGSPDLSFTVKLTFEAQERQKPVEPHQEPTA